MKAKKIIISSAFSGEGNNVTAAVADALSKLKRTGGTLCFEKGIYHFFAENAFSKFLAIPGSYLGNRKIIFPIFDFNNLTIDGGDSTFVFHGGAFPFAIRNSLNIALKNFLIDISDNVDFNEEACKLSDDNALFFDRCENSALENVSVSTAKELIVKG